MKHKVLTTNYIDYKDTVVPEYLIDYLLSNEVNYNYLEGDTL